MFRLFNGFKITEFQKTNLIRAYFAYSGKTIIRVLNNEVSLNVLPLL